jgi:3-oxoacyl-[acyl-carrier-protein] synthase-3
MSLELKSMPGALVTEERSPRANAGILGLGMHVPETVLTNDDLSRIVETSDAWISDRTGIRQRRIADADTSTSDLAAAASERALADAGVSPLELDLIICATTTGDYVWPSTACVVQEKIGAKRAAAFDLGAACSGFCYAVASATAFIESGVMRRILVIGADALSRQVNWQDRSTCVLFGDGAGAVVMGECSPGMGVLSSSLGADGSGIEAVWVPAGGTRMPITQDVIDRKLNCIAMRGPEVYKFAVRVVPEVILDALKRACLTTADVDLYVLHQANVRIMRAAAERLGIPEEKLFINLDRYGNTSAASVPMALAEASAQGRLQRGSVVVTVGFGAGLTWAANVIRWNR